MSGPLKTTRFKSQGIAECEQCQQQGDWTRERARQHANRKGHTVRFVIEDTTVYEPLAKDGAE
jgi:hypothetical protein